MPAIQSQFPNYGSATMPKNTVLFLTNSRFEPPSDHGRSSEIHSIDPPILRTAGCVPLVQILAQRRQLPTPLSPIVVSLRRNDDTNIEVDAEYYVLHQKRHECKGDCRAIYGIPFRVQGGRIDREESISCTDDEEGYGDGGRFENLYVAWLRINY